MPEIFISVRKAASGQGYKKCICKTVRKECSANMSDWNENDCCLAAAVKIVWSLAIKIKYLVLLFFIMIYIFFLAFFRYNNIFFYIFICITIEIILVFAQFQIQSCSIHQVVITLYFLRLLDLITPKSWNAPLFEVWLFSTFCQMTKIFKKPTER